LLKASENAVTGATSEPAKVWGDYIQNDAMCTSKRLNMDPEGLIGRPID
jgi:hypothetical protein